MLVHTPHLRCTLQIEDLTEKLERVQAKIPPALRKPVPPVPTLDIEELPEQ